MWANLFHVSSDFISQACLLSWSFWILRGLVRLNTNINLISEPGFCFVSHPDPSAEHLLGNSVIVSAENQVPWRPGYRHVPYTQGVLLGFVLFLSWVSWCLSWLSWNYLCRPGCPQTHRYLPIAASQVQGLRCAPPLLAYLGFKHSILLFPFPSFPTPCH